MRGRTLRVRMSSDMKLYKESRFTLMVTQRELQLIERALYNDSPADDSVSDENFALWDKLGDEMGALCVNTIDRSSS